MPVRVRSSEGLGAAFRQCSKYMLGPLLWTHERHFVNLIPAGDIPPREPVVNPLAVLEGVVAIGVVDVDFLPRRKDENSAMELQTAQHCFGIWFRQQRSLSCHGN